MSDPALESTRRRLTAKQAETVDRLGRSAVELLSREGFAGLTVRRVAAAAGVGAATAYTYFSSKEHLVAEVFWRRLSAMPPTPPGSDGAATHVVDVLRRIALLVADEPDFAGAVTSALLGRDPDVQVLRQRIGLDIRQRLAAALGPTADPDLLDALEMLYSGALVRAGMGHASQAEIATRLEKSVRLLLGQSSATSPSSASAAVAADASIPRTSRPAST